MKNQQSKQGVDDTTARLHAHAPKAHALYKEGKRIVREKRRRDWYERNKDNK